MRFQLVACNWCTFFPLLSSRYPSEQFWIHLTHTASHLWSSTSGPSKCALVQTDMTLYYLNNWESN